MPQSFRKRYAHLIAEQRARLRHVGAEPKHISGAPLAVDDFKVRTSGDLADRAREIVHRHFCADSEVDRPSNRYGLRAGQDDSARRVRHVSEITRLRAVTENHYRLPRQTAQEELRNHFATVSLVVAAWSVGIEGPHHHRRISERPVEGARVRLAREV